MQVRVRKRNSSGIVRAQFFAASAAARGRNLSEAAKYVDSFEDGFQTRVRFSPPPFSFSWHWSAQSRRVIYIHFRIHRNNITAAPLLAEGEIFTGLTGFLRMNRNFCSVTRQSPKLLLSIIKNPVNPVKIFPLAKSA